MKKFVRSVPAILVASAACLSLIALAGCGGSGSSTGSNTPSGPAAAQHIYAIQHTGVLGVSDQDSVVVFSASATGSTAPTSTLMLPSGFVGVSLAVGPQGQIYVGGSTEDNDGFGQILEYPAGASGSTAPSVTLNGSSDETATFEYPQNIAVNSAGTLFVSSTDGSLEAFASGLTAASVPSQYLTWGKQVNPNNELDNFAIGGDSIGVDTAGEIFYVDPGNDVIDVFAANATGATAPARTITGTDTNFFSELSYIAVDGTGDVYVANYNSNNDPSFSQPETKPGTYAANKQQAIWPSSASRLMANPHIPTTYEPTEIIEFAAGASGKAMPMKRIGGSATKIVEPQGLALDAVSNLYYADANGGYFSDANPLPSVLLEVFPSSATGNVAPAASITSSSFTYPDLNIGEGSPSVTGEFATGVAVR